MPAKSTKAQQRGAAGKKVSAGRHSEILPGLFLGNKDAVEELPCLAAVANVGGGKSVHPNTHRVHIADSHETSMLPIFPGMCEFLRREWSGRNLDVPLSAEFSKMGLRGDVLRPRGVLTILTRDAVRAHILREITPAEEPGQQQALPPGDTDDTACRLTADLQNCRDLPVLAPGKGPRAVLVHCRAGMHRSPAVACAFLIFEFNLTTAQALEFVKKKRSIAVPTERQVADLLEWERMNAAQGEAERPQAVAAQQQGVSEAQQPQANVSAHVEPLVRAPAGSSQ